MGHTCSEVLQLVFKSPFLNLNFKLLEIICLLFLNSPKLRISTFLSLGWSDFGFKTQIDQHLIYKILVYQPGPSKSTQRRTVVTTCACVTEFV